MRPSVPDDHSDLPDAANEAGEAPDDAALARMEAELDGQLASQGLTALYLETLTSELAQVAPEAKYEALRDLHARAMRGAPAGAAGQAAVKKLFGARPRTIRGRYVLSRTIGFGIAAGAAILGVGLGAGRMMFGRSEPTQIASTTTDDRQYVAAPGRRINFRLSDGSTVMLAPGSTLRTHAHFGTDMRDVYLEGEGYFDVRHNARVPFRVHTARGVAEDIGTRFTVRAYAGDAQSRIVVTEGQVAVGVGVILNAGDMAYVTTTAMPVVRRGVAVHPFVAWTKGQLEFVDAPLRDALADVSRWYGIDVRVEDPILAQHLVTGVFRDLSAGAMLESIARVVGARIDTHGSTRVFVPARAVR